MISVSIVSHGHGAMLPALLADLAACPAVSCVILTQNMPEADFILDATLPYGLVRLRNIHPKGFGANHNAAFAHCTTPFFCVLNPDVRMERDPFPVLLQVLEDERVALCAPAVVAPDGCIEDSVRHFPRPLGLIGKALGLSDGRYLFALGDAPLTPEWVAGMFMLLRARDYAAIAGFDEAFHLYYEDVDLCARLWQAGRAVVACPGSAVIHDARRASRRNLRHLSWHLASMLRFMIKQLWRLPAVPPLVPERLRR
jgi:GT2 family glycosyltransferase